MTNRKFTPPTEFPAEYVDGDGNKAVILVRGPNKKFPFVGHDADGWSRDWTETGVYHAGGPSRHDLHDIPKRITTWHNVYHNLISSQYSTRSKTDNWGDDSRLCVYRIERDEDGGNPEIFVEDV